MTTDPLAFLRATLDAAQQGAEAATQGEWLSKPSGDAWLIDVAGAAPTQEYVAAGDTCGMFRCPTGGAISKQADAQFIAANSPAATLRRIAADRALLADLLAERHLVNDGDCWYTCRAATEERDGGETCNDTERGKPCDCGRDARVERRVRIIAEGWGWTEEAS